MKQELQDLISNFLSSRGYDVRQVWVEDEHNLLNRDSILAINDQTLKIWIKAQK